VKLILNLYAVLGAIVSPAHAALDENAFALFENGAYEQAASDAVTAGGAENYALAARSLNALAYLEHKNKPARKIAGRALDYADAAIEADPALIEGYLQAAISYAQRGTRMAPWRAFLKGLAGRARDELDLALALEPANAWALSSSAAWHLEVARRGGDGRFGSDPALGHQQFIKARAAAPENLVIAYECALRLIAYDHSANDSSGWRGDGLEALQYAVASPPRDAFERAVQARARDFQVAIAEGRKAERAFIKAQP